MPRPKGKHTPASDSHPLPPTESNHAPSTSETPTSNRIYNLTLLIRTLLRKQPPSPKPNRLLSLPSELRNQILSLALRPSHTLWFHNLRQPALTQTCHQLQTEGLHQFFHQTNFHILLNLSRRRWHQYTQYIHPRTRAWLTRIDPSILSSIRNITITIQCPYHRNFQHLTTVNLWSRTSSLSPNWKKKNLPEGFPVRFLEECSKRLMATTTQIPIFEFVRELESCAWASSPNWVQRHSHGCRGSGDRLADCLLLQR
jgi:hypothetical protein